MSRVAVVTDSVACLPRELVEKYNIYVVPLVVIFGDQTYRDGVDLTPSEFYTLLQKSEKLPTTSSPPPGAFLEAYHEVSRRAENILCITVTSNLSMGFESAREALEIAREELPETTISVLNSKTAAGAQGFVVLAAARAAALGQGLAQVAEAAQSIIPRVNLIATIDTLYYLAKGGRVPRAAAWAGSLLRFKPILQISGGEVGLLERPRTKPRAVARLIQIMKERAKAKPVHVNVMHANVPEEAERLKGQISSQFNCTELYVTDFTPVMGAHTGPGVLGIAFYTG